MKKIILLFILLFTLVLSLEVKKVFADEWNVITTASGDKYMFETETGDILEIEKKTGQYEYRIRYADSKTLYLNFNKRIAFLKFYESTSYYILYGSVYNNYDEDSVTTIPYIFRLTKDVNEIKYYYDTRKEVKGPSHYCNILEFKKDRFLVTEFYNGHYEFGSYDGLYSLNYFDDNISLLKSIDCGTQECSVSIAYDTIDVVDSSKNHIYFDQDFNILESYAKEKIYKGYYETEVELYVDGILYVTGSIISQPGRYTLSDNCHENRIITIEPIITIGGEKENDYYKDYVDYKVSGGSVFIDNESSYLNGIVSSPGIHEIKVIGANDYVYQETFKILPKLISDITDGCSIKTGDIIEFNGDGRLNGTMISSGYRIDEKGTYTLELLVGDEIVSSYTFVANEEVIKKKDKKLAYIVLISSFIALSAVTVFVIFKEKKKREIVVELED